jgi:putative oxidoreductase
VSPKIVPESKEAAVPDRKGRAFLLECCAVGKYLRLPETLMKFLKPLQPLGLLLLRLSLAVIFVTHGYPKLSHPSGAVRGIFIQHGLPGYFVYVAGVLEVFGGLLLALGLFTRVAALLLAVEMGVAIWKVHSGGGYLAIHNYEFPLVLAAACFATATIGAGVLSLDHPLFEGGGGRSRAAKSAKSDR